MRVSSDEVAIVPTKAKEKNIPINHKVAMLIACGLSFFSTFEPNAIVRYGPFFAVIAFFLSSPLSLRFGATEVWLFCYIGWSLLSFYWAILPDRFNQNFLLVSSVAIIFLGLRATLDRGGLLAITLSYVSGSFVGFGITSLQLINTGLVQMDMSGRITQVGELNVNPVAYSGVISILLLLFLLRKSDPRNRFLKVLFIGLIGALIFCITSTQTRGAMLALAMIVIGTLLFKIKFPSKLLLISYSILYTLITVGIFNNLLSILDKGARVDSGLSGRTSLWDEASTAWATNPLLGVGLGGVRGVTDSGLTAHNVFLGVGVSVGIVGLLFFILFIGSALSDRNHNDHPEDRLFQLIVLSSAFFPILLSSSMENSASGWVGLALLSSVGVSKERASSTRNAEDSSRSKD